MCNRLMALAATIITSIAGVGCETIYHAATGPGKSAATSPAAPNGADESDIASRTAMLPSCDGASGCLTVMTFNTKHRDVPLQLDAVARQIKAEASHLPDFILLQEVVFGRPARKGKANTAAELADLLGCQAQGSARDGGEEGVAILSPHPFDFYDHIHLQARDALLSGGFPRVSVMGEFQIEGVGRVRVVNVHLTQRPSQHDIRRDQLNETLEWMNKRQAVVPADVIILGGDFNSEPGWDELALMRDSTACGNLKFNDFNSQYASSGKVGEPYQRVDYFFVAAPHKTVGSVGEAILWRNGIPTSSGTGTFYPSDHLPLVQVFTFGPGA